MRSGFRTHELTEPSTSTATRSWARHPSDLARLVMSLLALTAGLAAVAASPDLVRGASSDLIRLVLRLPHGVRASLLGLTQLVAVIAPIALVGLLAWHRRVRLAVVVLGAAGLTALLMVMLQGWLDRTVPSQVMERGETESWVSGSAFPSGTYLAAITAAVVVLTPLAAPAGRKAAWLGVFAAATCRLVTAVAVPINLVVTVAIGAVVGSAVVAVVGAPRRRFSLDEVEEGVRRAGAEVGALRVVEDTSHRRRFETTANVDDRSVPAVVTLIGRDDRNGDLVLRALRWIRTKGIDDARLGWRPGDRAEHEAFATMLAASTTNAPEMLGVAETPAGDGVLVLAVPSGSALADLDSDQITDDVLDAVWTQVVGLQGRHLAHRALHAGHILLDDVGKTHVVEFGSAIPGAASRELLADLAEVLTSMAVLVGADRSVAAAVRSSIPREDLEAALPLIQPAALSSATRRAIRGRKDLVADVRTGMQEAIGADAVVLTELERIGKGKVLSTFGLVLLAAVVLAFASNASAIGEALGEMDGSYLLPMASTVVISYLASAWALVGAVTAPLPFWRTVQVMLAQTILNRFTPANAGGMALRARFLQKHGVELAVAAASVGLTSAASGLVQVAFLVVLFSWAGTSGTLDISLPSTSAVALALLVVTVLAGIVYMTAWGRRVLYDKVVNALASVTGEIRKLATQPSKVVALFGGAAIMKLTSIAAFHLACAAFGISFSLPESALLFMTANTIASAAPTPGGIGAVEAALVAALTSTGVEPATALGAVLVFRLVTFWAPVPPSWLALQQLRKADVV